MLFLSLSKKVSNHNCVLVFLFDTSNSTGSMAQILSANFGKAIANELSTVMSIEVVEKLSNHALDKLL